MGVEEEEGEGGGEGEEEDDEEEDEEDAETSARLFWEGEGEGDCWVCVTGVIVSDVDSTDVSICKDVLLSSDDEVSV